MKDHYEAYEMGKLWIDKALDAIAALSKRSHREVLDVLPTIRRHGEQTVNAWVTAARRLLEYDIDAGSAFIFGTREAEHISETVMPWTAQTLRFLLWPAATGAIDGFMKNLPRAFGTLAAGPVGWDAGNIGATDGLRCVGAEIGASAATTAPLFNAVEGSRPLKSSRHSATLLGRTPSSMFMPHSMARRKRWSYRARATASDAGTLSSRMRLIASGGFSPVTAR